MAGTRVYLKQSAKPQNKLSGTFADYATYMYKSNSRALVLFHI